jgi:hypothetical protein
MHKTYARNADTGLLIHNDTDQLYYRLTNGGVCEKSDWSPCCRELRELDEQCQVLFTALNEMLVLTEVGLYTKQSGSYTLCQPLGQQVVSLESNLIIQLGDGMYYSYSFIGKWCHIPDYRPSIRELNNGVGRHDRLLCAIPISELDRIGVDGMPHSYITSDSGFIIISKCPCEYNNVTCENPDCVVGSVIIKGIVVDYIPILECLLLEDGSMYNIFDHKVLQHVHMGNKHRKPAH